MNALATGTRQCPLNNGSRSEARRNRRRRVLAAVWTTITAGCASVALLTLAAVIGYVIARGAPGLGLSLFTELPRPGNMQGGGVGNAILGTAIMVGLAVLITGPLSMLAAVYLSEFARGNRLSRLVEGAVDMLSTTPSIIIGLFSYAVLVVLMGSFSAIAGALALSLVMMPIMIRSMEEALRAVPDELRMGALALGASSVAAATKVVVPAALPSLITGAMLAIARAAGESAPLIFTALFSNFWPNGLTTPIASLSVLIYNFALLPFPAQQQLAWSAALVLVALVVALNVVARLLSTPGKRAFGKRG